MTMLKKISITIGEKVLDYDQWIILDFVKISTTIDNYSWPFNVLDYDR